MQNRAERRRQLRQAAKRASRLRRTDPITAAKHEQYFVEAAQLAINHVAAGNTVWFDWNPRTREAGLAALNDLEDGKASVLNHLVWPEGASLASSQATIQMGLAIADVAPRTAQELVHEGFLEEAREKAKEPRLRQAFKKAWMALPQRLRHVLELSLEGLSEEQISKTLFVTPAVAGDLLNEGYTQLRVLALRDYDNEGEDEASDTEANDGKC